jgi:cold shock CspA family protein
VEPQPRVGFLAPDNAEHDIFVHVSEIRDRRRLVEGQRVEFESGTRQNKPIALHVVVISEPEVGAQSTSKPMALNATPVNGGSCNEQQN